MNTSYRSIKKSIESHIQTLIADTSVVQNFIDIDTLEEFWRSIELEESDPKDFKRKRQEIEDELYLFTRVIREIYLGTQTKQKEPNWLKSGHKETEIFFTAFFKELKTIDIQILNQAVQITQKNLSFYRELFMQWKIAKKREKDAQKMITQKMKQARAFKKGLEGLVELSKID